MQPAKNSTSEYGTLAEKFPHPWYRLTKLIVSNHLECCRLYSQCRTTHQRLDTETIPSTHCGCTPQNRPTHSISVYVSALVHSFDVDLFITAAEHELTIMTW